MSARRRTVAHDLELPRRTSAAASSATRTRSTGTRSTTPSCMSFPDPSAPWSRSTAQTGDADRPRTAPSWDCAATRSQPALRGRFGFQHFPNITPTGTLMVSSHMPGYEDTDDAAGRASTRSSSSPSTARTTPDREVELHRGAGVGAVQGHGDPPAQRQHAGQLRHRRRDPRDHAGQADRVPREVRRRRAATTSSTRWSATTC